MTSHFESIFQDAINDFSPISLAEMDRVALMNRTDPKFILKKDLLLEIFPEIKSSYAVLEVGGFRLNRYNSMYYDTPGFDFFKDHHRGKRGRAKVRIRTYVESALSFLEVKVKDKKGDTEKTRIKVDGFEPQFSQEQQTFINTTIGKDLHLSPVLQNAFTRITLVNKTEEERATIDLDLRFNGGMTLTGNGNNLVIIEVKQSGFKRSSPIVQSLRKRKIHPYSISKYCMGLGLIHQELKQNKFKEKFLKINKIAS